MAPIQSTQHFCRRNREYMVGNRGLGVCPSHLDALLRDGTQDCVSPRARRIVAQQIHMSTLRRCAACSRRRELPIFELSLWKKVPFTTRRSRFVSRRQGSGLLLQQLEALDKQHAPRAGAAFHPDGFFIAPLAGNFFPTTTRTKIYSGPRKFRLCLVHRVHRNECEVMDWRSPSFMATEWWGICAWYTQRQHWGRICWMGDKRWKF